MTAPRRILLHVGAPKTGTSFVQDLLFQNRERLAELGVLYPADRFDAHFLAALDLMQLPWGGLEKQAVGAWDRLAEQARSWEGTVVISHEILATATEEHVKRALESFGPDAEIHVLVSVRDLVRQIPAEWQENVKHRRDLTYARFLEVVRDPEATGAVATWFWSVQDIPRILDRWGADLPKHRVHVVTVPQPGAPRTLLWERFASVFGIDPGDLDVSRAKRSNPSLGVAESALIRLVNSRVKNGVLSNEDYRVMVRELLAHRTLSWREDAIRLRLPDDVRDWASGLSEEWIAELAARGYDVVGSLEELRPDAEEHTEFVDPDRVDPELVEDVALQSIETLLLHAAELRAEIGRLHDRVEEVTRERDQARSEIGVVLRTKRAFVARADSSEAASRALRVYRKVRRR